MSGSAKDGGKSDASKSGSAKEKGSEKAAAIEFGRSLLHGADTEERSAPQKIGAQRAKGDSSGVSEQSTQQAHVAGTSKQQQESKQQEQQHQSPQQQPSPSQQAASPFERASLEAAKPFAHASPFERASAESAEATTTTSPFKRASLEAAKPPSQHASPFERASAESAEATTTTSPFKRASVESTETAAAASTSPFQQASGAVPSKTSQPSPFQQASQEAPSKPAAPVAPSPFQQASTASVAPSPFQQASATAVAPLPFQQAQPQTTAPSPFQQAQPSTQQPAASPFQQASQAAPPKPPAAPEPPHPSPPLPSQQEGEHTQHTQHTQPTQRTGEHGTPTPPPSTATTTDSIFSPHSSNNKLPAPLNFPPALLDSQIGTATHASTSNPTTHTSTQHHTDSSSSTAAPLSTSTPSAATPHGANSPTAVAPGFSSSAMAASTAASASAAAPNATASLASAKSYSKNLSMLNEANAIPEDKPYVPQPSARRPRRSSSSNSHLGARSPTLIPSSPPRSAELPKLSPSKAAADSRYSQGSPFQQQRHHHQQQQSQPQSDVSQGLLGQGQQQHHQQQQQRRNAHSPLLQRTSSGTSGGADADVEGSSLSSSQDNRQGSNNRVHATRAYSTSLVPQGKPGAVAMQALSVARGRQRGGMSFDGGTSSGSDLFGSGFQHDMVRQEQQRQQQQLIASENDDDIMRGAVLAAESAAAGTDAKEDPSAVLDGQLQRPALVTEFLSGCSLGTAIKRRADFLSSDLVMVKVALDAARGMEYCHTKQLVHWNLKPNNLIIGFSASKVPLCKLSDLGKQRRLVDLDDAGVGRMLPWAAPELLCSPSTANEKVDVYSYGMIMWSMWARRCPYEGQDVSRLLLRILQGRVVRPPLPGTKEWDALFTHQANPPSEPAEGWRDLMEKCWAQDPKARPDFATITPAMFHMFNTNKSARRAARVGKEQKGKEQSQQQQDKPQTEQPQQSKEQQ